MRDRWSDCFGAVFSGSGGWEPAPKQPLARPISMSQFFPKIDTAASIAIIAPALARGDLSMLAVNSIRAAALAGFLVAATAGCSHTLPQSFTFSASESMSLAVVDYPTPNDGSLKMNTLLFQGVDLERSETNNRIIALEPAIIGTKQLKPDLALDDGSLYPLERQAQQTFFVPIALTPGDYIVKGGLSAPIGIGVASPSGAVIVGSLQEETSFCRAPIFRVPSNSIAIVDARGMLARSGNKNFWSDPDPKRIFRRGKIAIGGYQQVQGEVVQAQYLGTAVFPSHAGTCSQDGSFRFEPTN